MTVNVGLDIGTGAVRAAVVETVKNGPPVLRKYGEVALPEGAVQNGEIIDDAIVQDALARLFKQAKLPKKRVIVGLANQRVIVRQVDLPYMPEDELAESLAFQAQEYIPIPIDEAILDFVPLEEFSTPDGTPRMSVLVVAAQKDMATEVVAVLAGIGVKPMAIDLQAFALVRAATGGDLDLDPNPKAIVNIGGSLTQVIVVKGGAMRFLRIIPMGGRDFTRSLADDLGIDQDQAEQLKRRIGVALEEIPRGTEGDDAA
ncbi:MAG: type IV pilus assembly protein PilM, partial [Acidimicrobiia bacterium]|nr:type IV pilus assembly protein PilM [Acidimicrobiia bacterium]